MTSFEAAAANVVKLRIARDRKLAEVKEARRNERLAQLEKEYDAAHKALCDAMDVEQAARAELAKKAEAEVK